jgi:hypothetical protein
MPAAFGPGEEGLGPPPRQLDAEPGPGAKPRDAAPPGGIAPFDGENEVGQGRPSLRGAGEAELQDLDAGIEAQGRAGEEGETERQGETGPERFPRRAEVGRLRLHGHPYAPLPSRRLRAGGLPGRIYCVVEVFSPYLGAMEDSQAFARKLEERLDAERDRLDHTELPAMKSNFRLFQTSYQGIYNVLYRKGVLHEDPYKFELKISEVTNPPEGPFSESEKIDQLSVRLSQFDSYLDFLNNYYQFSTDFLAMGRIKRLLGLVKYFNFTQFAETSNQVNTKALAELVSQVRKGTDQLSTGILTEALGQLDRASREILASLKALTAYHRERYKLELRDLVSIGLSFTPDFLAAHHDDAMKQLKRKFAEVASERPFYPELAEELLQEDYSAEGPALREAVLERFAPKEEKKIEEAKEKSYKGVILDGIRNLAGVNFTVQNAIDKLAENSNFLESRNQGFIVKLKAMFRSIFSPGDKGIHYEIELVDPVSGSHTSETIDFSAFIEEGNRKSRNLAGLLQKNGPSWRRLETAQEDQAFKFLEKNMEELQILMKRMNALEEYFRTAAAAEDRAKLRSVKTDTTTIKGALIKANQKKHEYVAQKEEQEQMRRLGFSAQ